MKKPKVHILVMITLVFAAFTSGLYLGRSHGAAPITVSVPSSMQTLPPKTIQAAEVPTEETTGITFPIDINRASAEEFMVLPGIGEVLAQRILDYRKEYGPFENAESLMNVEGIGQKRMEQILDLITIGG